ncbi:zinc finger CCCH domain-containing protein 66 isoform X2 [Populus alba x Populus x berolinensis]|nr:zinc finger CCCH domain-containing protein 66 isoform X2 [Populus alba x Populus x berolinensis]
MNFKKIGKTGFRVCCDFSLLLELSASNDLTGFKRAIEEEGHDIDEPGHVDVNRGYGSDGATALHCAAAGGSSSAPEVARLLLDASADPSSVDANGNHPGDLIAPVVESDGLEQQEISTPRVSKDGHEKKEYPIDLTLPDIKNGIYGTDEFRMYTFKVKPCSRAYSHDWTECPFVHPGENARRRDPRKYHYSCVPCPEFRKGSCRQGDACEYAHGIFECWLHPAQYRTRLCKDETVSIRPLSLGSPSGLIPSTSTPPTPSGSSSPIGGWTNQSNVAPPPLQLPGSRLKSALCARDMDLDMELLGLESHRRRQAVYG